MVDNQQILGFISQKGPSLPVHVSKASGINIIMAGAVLSSLVSAGKVKISKIKIGGSPLYYLPGQENRLAEFSKHLDPKALQVFQLLQQDGIVRDGNLDPALRVAVRSLNDFAVPLDVTYNNQTYTFWKWYLLPDDQVEKAIARLLSPTGNGMATPEKEAPAIEVPINESISEPALPVQEEAAESVVVSPTSELTPGPVKAEPKQEPLKPAEPKIEKEPLKISDQANAIVQEMTRPDVFKKKQKQTRLAQKEMPTEEFYQIVTSFFDEKDIDIIDWTVIRKGADYEFNLSVPTPVGSVKFWCKAKSKKKFNEGDISAIYLEGQTKRLPIILLTNGTLTKKAESLLDTRFIGLAIAKI